jgi:hypothetical protein
MSNEITDLLKSVQGLITSTAALIAALGAFYALWRKKPTGRHKPIDREARRRKILLLAVSCLVLIASLGVAFYFAPESASGVRARTVRTAWRSIDKEAWNAAIGSADKVIAEFAPTAEREQRQLEAAKAPKPPIGSVPDGERATIFNRGVLNDVATCYFIKSKALERVGRKQEAERVYGEAARLTYARTWDPNDACFFSPAQAAEDRLVVLSKN